ncbi:MULTISPECIES: hypothetical protein [Fusobacterium]|uniref:Lipoprotein n=1 Tax=Fusobacterium mortiferum TaxID=850 RepID=A0A414PQ34_FUSMR|nr:MULTISPECIES: hypothetical protein [Fusobacterium]RGN00633.1 hypothetical protein DXB84_01755 [Fusobacterium mortiferum]RHF70639.1 hypothetical protein DW663_10165 [Fusobacterium mortiferum]
MKKLILILLGSLIFFSCSPNREERTKREIEKNEEIIAMFKSKYPEDNFYFIQGLDYEKDKNTNIRYRGILYSDRLEKLGYPYGMHLALEENDKGWGYLSDYEATFLKIQIDKPIEEKMKEIFGELSVLYNHYGVSIKGYKKFLADVGKDLPFDKKGRADYTIVNVFVDRLEDINKEEMKRKTYEFARFLQDNMNLATYLQVYIRDNTFFEDYNLVAYQVYPPFREREDIKKILEKIKTKEEISKDEKIALVNVFYKNFNYKMRYTDIFIWFSDVELESYDKQKFNGSLLWKDYINEGRK